MIGRNSIVNAKKFSEHNAKDFVTERKRNPESSLPLQRYPKKAKLFYSITMFSYLI